MSENRRGLFVGMPRRDGYENIGFILLIVIGVFLGLTKFAVLNNLISLNLDFIRLGKFMLWSDVVQCWNNNSPVFRGMASNVLKIDLVGIVSSMCVSIVFVKNVSIKEWARHQSYKTLLIILTILVVVMLSDYFASLFCSSIEKESVGAIVYLTHNTQLGLLFQTYLIVFAGYYTPSLVRMMLQKAM